MIAQTVCLWILKTEDDETIMEREMFTEGSRRLLPRFALGAILVSLFAPIVLIDGASSASSLRAVRRLGGLDRYATAVEVSKAFHPSTATTVVLATGQTYADSLSGSALAAKLDAPLLLSTWGNIPRVTQLEIQRLKPAQVIVLGGTTALSQEIESQLSGLGVTNLVRLSGENRYETSVKIAEFGWPTASSLTSGKVYLASGEEFGPGLIAGAAAGRVDSPVLLSQTRFLSTVLANEIRRLKPSQVVQVGYGTGPGNISTSISSAASELVGASRVIIYETTLNDLSVTVAEQTPNRGLLAPVVVLVSSENFPDALAAGAAAGSAAMPLLMSSKSCLPKNVSDQISRYQTSSLLVVGLAAAVSDSTANGLICSAVPPTSTAPPQTSSPTATSGLPANTTQGIIYGTYGCKNQIQMGALSYAGQVVSTKVLVQSTQNVQLIPYGLSPSNELLFSSYNCDSRTYSVYRQQLGANPTLRLVMSLPSTWGIIGGTWDVARNAPAVLLRDPNFAYSIQVHNGSGWSVAASFPRNSFGTYYPTGLQSLSGFEYRIWGSSTSAWKVWRLGSAGYLSEILNGAGYLNSVSSAPLERSLALLSSSGTWICEGYANGSISILIGQGKCSSATNATARYAAFTYANSDAASFWLHLIPSGISGTSRLKVICRLSSLLNCEGPSIQERQVGVISGNNPLTVSLFSLPNFNQLAPTNVP